GPLRHYDGVESVYRPADPTGGKRVVCWLFDFRGEDTAAHSTAAAVLCRAADRADDDHLYPADFPVCSTVVGIDVKENRVRTCPHPAIVTRCRPDKALSAAIRHFLSDR